MKLKPDTWRRSAVKKVSIELVQYKTTRIDGKDYDLIQYLYTRPGGLVAIDLIHQPSGEWQAEFMRVKDGLKLQLWKDYPKEPTMRQLVIQAGKFYFEFYKIL